MKKKFIYIIISLIIVILLFFFIRITLKSTKKDENINFIKNDNANNEIEQEEIFEGSQLGTLTIPKIKIYDVKVCESVELNVLAHSIGHFENTNIYEGNVGLASHNAGTKANYFANINKLKKGDEIYYKTNFGTKIYIVDKITNINSYDWSYLSETKDNRITLITCISGNPKMRLCVQGIEKRD